MNPSPLPLPTGRQGERVGEGGKENTLKLASACIMEYIKVGKERKV